MTRRRFPFAAAAALLAMLSLLLLVVACGDDNGDTDELALSETSVDVSLSEFMVILP